jgi:hypothetical protein
MNYTKMELRNNKNNLLRRVQRQMDLDSCKKECDNILKVDLKKEKKSKGFDLFGEDNYEEEVFEPSIKKNTRLGLLKVRGGR